MAPCVAQQPRPLPCPSPTARGRSLRGSKSLHSQSEELQCFSAMCDPGGGGGGVVRKKWVLCFLCRCFFRHPLRSGSSALRWLSGRESLRSLLSDPPVGHGLVRHRLQRRYSRNPGSEELRRPPPGGAVDLSWSRGLAVPFRISEAADYRYDFLRRRDLGAHCHAAASGP